MSLRECELPVVDLADLHCAGGRPRIIRQIMQNLKERNTFYIINHGIPVSLLETLMHAGESFFNLPLKEKAPYAIEQMPKGFGEGFFGGKVQLSDDFGHDHKNTFRLITHPPTKVSLDKWPPSHREEAASIAKMSDAATSLALALLSLLAEGLNVDYSSIERAIGEPLLGFVQTRYKPRHEIDVDVVLPGHLDAGLFYFLFEHTDRVTATQVNRLGPDGEETWQTVRRPHPDALLVLVSEQLEVLTNGKVKGSYHRVLAPKETRFSTLLVFLPEVDLPMRPLPELVEASGQPSPYKTTSIVDRLAELRDHGFRRSDIFISAT